MCVHVWCIYVYLYDIYIYVTIIRAKEAISLEGEGGVWDELKGEKARVEVKYLYCNLKYLKYKKYLVFYTEKTRKKQFLESDLWDLKEK